MDRVKLENGTNCTPQSKLYLESVSHNWDGWMPNCVGFEGTTLVGKMLPMGSEAGNWGKAQPTFFSIVHVQKMLQRKESASWENKNM